MIRENPNNNEEEKEDLGYPPGMLGRGFTKVNEILAGVDL